MRLFLTISEQWRVSMNGPYALDYNVVYHELDRAKTSDDDYDDMMKSIRVIEAAALEAIHDRG